MGADIEIESRAGPLKAYLATPGDDGAHPGVVIVHEGFGLTDDTQAWTDRFAQAGYLGVAPDLFSRGPGIVCLMAAFRALLRGRGDAVDDLEAARAYLRDRDDCTGKVGVVGFCMGGGFALVMAPRGFDASAPFYGLIPRDTEKALSGACPIVASYGRRDFALRGGAAKLERTLDRLEVPNDVKEYPDVGHSFMNRHQGWQTAFDRIPGFGYDAESSEDAWQRVTGFFAAHLAD